MSEDLIAPKPPKTPGHLMLLRFARENECFSNTDGTVKIAMTMVERIAEALAGQQGEARPARTEREAFEKWYASKLDGRELETPFKCHAESGWMARAALATQAAPEAQAEPAGRHRAWHAQEDPRCAVTGKEACIDCLMQGKCIDAALADGGAR